MDTETASLRRRQKKTNKKFGNVPANKNGIFDAVRQQPDDRLMNPVGYDSSKAVLVCLDETNGKHAAPSLNGMAKQDCDLLEDALRAMKFDVFRLNDDAATTGAISNAFLGLSSLRSIEADYTQHVDSEHMEKYNTLKVMASRRLVVFWVGHGLTKVGTGHFLTYDGILPMASIKDYAQLIGIYSQLWLFDACYSGFVLSSGKAVGPEAAHVNTFGGAYLTKLEAERAKMTYFGTLMHRPAVYAMTASTYTQTSKGIQGQSGTAFAGNVARELRGALKKMTLSARELFDAVREDTFNAVSEQSPQFGKLTDDTSGMFFFCGELGGFDCSKAQVQTRPAYDTTKENALSGGPANYQVVYPHSPLCKRTMFDCTSLLWTLNYHAYSARKES